MKCRDVMTPNPRTCSEGATLREAAQVMQVEDVGLVPVVHSINQRLEGVVTDRDLCLEVVANGTSPDAPLMEVMTLEPVTCQPDDDIRTCEDLMQRHQLRRILVVNDEGQCVGIIAQADIALKITEPHEVQETVRDISRPPETGAAALGC